MKAYNKDPNAREFVRFGFHPRIEHWLVIITFAVLTATGLPQKFSGMDWARWVVRAFHGLDTMRTIHRFTGWTMTVLAVEHVAIGIYLLVFRGRTAMVPRGKDFRDAIDYLKWCLGLSKSQPRMGRYDYRQKFEYWGLLMGSAIMIASGIILYFPLVVAKFMPGVVVAAAKVAHSTEALLALLTVITWHAYGAHFNPEVFPIDKSIFNGKIPRDRMLHEHPLEFEEWFGKEATEKAEAELHGEHHEEPADAPERDEKPEAA